MPRGRRAPAIKASVFVATSLDGFIARADESIDWLEAANAAVPDGEDLGYGRFIDTVDVLVMGRHTFDLVRTFDRWPYGALSVVVLSSGDVDVPGELREIVSTSAEAPRALLSRLAKEGRRHAYVDGGATVQRFLAEDLVDEITLTLIPVLLGEGRPLFGPIGRDAQLELRESTSYAFGFQQLRYAVKRPAPRSSRRSAES